AALGGFRAIFIFRKRKFTGCFANIVLGSGFSFGSAGEMISFGSRMSAVRTPSRAWRRNHLSQIRRRILDLA
ncbi:MAG: hypothetical protein N2A42_13095, partial [Luteolibacter sp.]